MISCRDHSHLLTHIQGFMDQWLGILLVLIVVSARAMEGDEDQMGAFVVRVVEEHLSGCHLVIVSQTIQSPTLSALLRLILIINLVVIIHICYAFYRLC